MNMWLVTDWLIDWEDGWPVVDWFNDWLNNTCLLIDWLTDFCFIDFLAVLLAEGLTIAWLTDGLTDWLTDWLTDCYWLLVIDWQNGWLIVDWFNDLLACLLIEWLTNLLLV